MKNFFMDVLVSCIEIMENFAKHKVLTVIVAVVVLLMHVLVNGYFMNKEVPLYHFVLQPWMAYINVITVGCVCGVTIGYVTHK